VAECGGLGHDDAPCARPDRIRPHLAREDELDQLGLTERAWRVVPQEVAELEVALYLRLSKHEGP
jgi:hypothetical protein